MDYLQSGLVPRLLGTFTRRTFANPYVVTLFDAASGAEVFRFEGSAKGTRIEL